MLKFVCKEFKMNTKLTLTIDKDIIEKAKRYARKRERSLSAMVENYLKSLVDTEKDSNSELSPIVKSLKGSFNLPENYDYKKELTDLLSEKYLNEKDIN